MFTPSSKKKSCMCVCSMGGWGGDGSPCAKATESGLNILRPLSLKVCQRVHGGRRPSKSTIMGFNAFHLRREKGLWLHVLRGVASTMYQFMAIRGIIKLLPRWRLGPRSEMPKPSINRHDSRSPVARVKCWIVCFCKPRVVKSVHYIRAASTFRQSRSDYIYTSWLFCQVEEGMLVMWQLGLTVDLNKKALFRRPFQHL